MRSVPDAVAAEPGEQVLVSIEAMSSVLPALPDEAFDNLLVVSPATPSRVESRIRKLGHDPGNCGLIPVTGSEVEYDGPLWTTDPVAPSDLTGISIRYSRAMQHVASDSGWFCFDNLQLLLMYANEQRVYQFLSQLTGQTRNRRVRGVYGIARDAVGDDTYARLAGLFDDTDDRR